MLGWSSAAARRAPQPVRDRAAVGGSGQHDLERDGPPQRHVERLEHRGHAATAAFALDFIFAAEHDANLRQQRILVLRDQGDGRRRGIGDCRAAKAAEPQADRHLGGAARAARHVPVAVNTSVFRPGAVAVAVLVPGVAPRVNVASAKPLALVVTLSWPAPAKLPPPAVTLNVTCTPATGRPASSTARTVNALDSAIARRPVCPSPRTLWSRATVLPLARGAAFQLDALTLPDRLSPVAVGSARRRGPRASPHHVCSMLIAGPTSLSTPAGALSKISFPCALKFDNEPSRRPMMLLEMKFESTRAPNAPPSMRTPAFKRCPVTLFCVIVMNGAVASSAAREAAVSPGAGLNPAPDMALPVAVKVVPENVTAARLSRNVDCCTRKNPPPTDTACPTFGVQAWNQLPVNVIELALLAWTQRPCSVTLTVSFCSVSASLPVPITPDSVLSKREPCTLRFEFSDRMPLRLPIAVLLETCAPACRGNDGLRTRTKRIALYGSWSARATSRKLLPVT